MCVRAFDVEITYVVSFITRSCCYCCCFQNMSLSLMHEKCLLLGYFSRVSTLSQFARRYFTRTRKDVWCPPLFVKMLGLTYFVFNELKAQAGLLNSLLSNISEFLKICCRRWKGSSLMISRARIGRIVFNLLDLLPGDGIWCFHTHSVFSSNMHLSCLQ